MGLLERIADARSRPAAGEQRSSIDQWLSEYLLPAGMVNQFTYNGQVYGFGSPNLTQARHLRLWLENVENVENADGS